jgi:hypothetical protein
MKKIKKILIRHWRLIPLCIVLAVFLFSACNALAQQPQPRQVQFDPGLRAVDIAEAVAGSGWPGSILLNYISEFLDWFNREVLGWFIDITANLLNSVIQLTNTANNYGIIVGWTILRDFANMFFIFIMLLISIATILRIEEYGARRMLARVIIVALLINFSRLFAFAIIDFSNVFVNAFIQAFVTTDAANNRIFDVASPLANGMNLNRLNSVNSSPPSSVSVLGTVAFNTIILTIILGAFLAALLLFIVRIIWLAFLVLTGPMAFLGYMVPWPMISNWWKEWWSNLFKWSFFAPIYLFFIYVTVVMIKSGAINRSFSNQVTNITVPAMTSATSAPMLLNMAVVVGFLIGGLLLAVNMAGKFGQTALKIGTGAAAIAAGGAAWLGRKGAAAYGRRSLRKYEEKEKQGKTPTGISRLAFLATQRLTAGSQATDRAAVEARKSQLKNQFGDNKAALHAKLLATVRPAEKTAIIARLEEITGGMRSDDPAIQKRINAGAVTAARLGFRPKSRPDLAAEGTTPGVNAQKAVADVTRKLTVKDGENLSPDAIDPAAVGAVRANDALIGMLQGLRPGVLAKIITENDAFATPLRTQMQNMATGLGQNFDQFVDHIETVLHNAELAYTLRNNVAAKTRFQF